MAFSQKLQTLRRERGLSQEKLGELVGVSRQAISKWESGQSYPDINNLVSLSQLFGVTIDSMVKEEPQNAPPFEQSLGESSRRTGALPWGYEYRSAKTLWGLPLVHIRLGYRLAPARGIVAIGNTAVGVVALGGVSVGVFSLGGLAVGGLALGGMAAGVVALGGLAVGMISVGGLAVGWAALGGGAVGEQLALGGGAISGHVALGGNAIAPVAVSAQRDLSSQMVLHGVAQPLDLELLAAAAQEEISPLLRPVLRLVLRMMGAAL